MYFPISGETINPLILIGIGFIVGLLGGFFGVGGSFLAGPALFTLGVPMNFVVGTDLAHIVGKSIVAAKKHRLLGNVDLKLGGIMVIGTVVGVELGARFIELLKRMGNVDKVVGWTFVSILVGISAFMTLEGVKTARMIREQGKQKTPATKSGRTRKKRMSPRSAISPRRFIASRSRLTSAYRYRASRGFRFGRSFSSP